MIKRGLILLLPTVVLFGLVRYYQDELFYDPFLNFFEGGMSEELWPNVEWWLLSSHLVFRFVINAMIGLLFISFMFQDLKVLGQAAIIYLGVLIIGIPIVIILGQMAQFNDYYLFFFFRRILIHPIIFFILIPAFIYQNLNKST